ncbi:MAG: hypothetical protein Q8S18_12925 [Bacteroidales bacterium]|nr:hypothetical protein [Bacteroidales bacterium]
MKNSVTKILMVIALFVLTSSHHASNGNVSHTNLLKPDSFKVYVDVQNLPSVFSNAKIIVYGSGLTTQQMVIYGNGEYNFTYDGHGSYSGAVYAKVVYLSYGCYYQGINYAFGTFDYDHPANISISSYSVTGCL